jgi:hypothetical protein
MMRNIVNLTVEKIEILKMIRAAEALVTETIARTIDVIGIENLERTIETGIITGVTIEIGNLGIVMTEKGINLGVKEANVDLVGIEVIVLIAVIVLIVLIVVTELTPVAIEIVETTTVIAGDLLVSPGDAAAETDALDLDPTVSPPEEKEMKASAKKFRDKPLKKEGP